eukprot:CAMPEP_0117695460 /NCGR_PEP_ID=MMETSP0804-20121206/28151_1 /TAXON_ID=1074897 /ORGANISM="Tetraselmis astigmatica, Strain CCMP880" /LENGTH=859 /DNA_ID=CAMNT_0005509533 /DNA_START=44 /DNA_END=2623 /DNA_ORIENTATION=-
MPAAQIFGRSLYVTPEDFALPSLLTCLVYAPCAVTLGVLIKDLKDELSVNTSSVVEALSGSQNAELRYTSSIVLERGQVYWISGRVLVACFAGLFCINLAVAAASSQGALLEKSKRAAVIPLVAASAAVSILMMVPLSIMTYGLDQSVAGLLGESYDKQSEETKALLDEWRYIDLMQAICILVWVVMIGTPVLILGVLSLFGNFRLLGRVCLVNLSVCMGCRDALENTEGSDTTIKQEVDHILRQLFGHLPLIGTDCSCGLFLLAQLHKLNRTRLLLGEDPLQVPSKEQMAASLQGIMTPPALPTEVAEDLAKPVPRPLKGCRRVDLATIEEGRHYVPWAEMAYGFLRSRKGRAKKLTEGNEDPKPFQDLQSVLFDLTQWQTTKAAPTDIPNETSDRDVTARKVLISESLEIPFDDVLDVRLDNKALGCVPYFIALDAATTSIVVSIRGSRSLHDALTDMITTAAPIHFVRGACELFDKEAAATDPVSGSASALGAEAAPVEIQAMLEPPPLACPPSTFLRQELKLEDGYGHRGMIVSASKIFKDIRERGHVTTLSALFLVPLQSQRGVACTKALAPDCVTYPLAKGPGAGGGRAAAWEARAPAVEGADDGHSLGAGLASLLTWALLPDLNGRLFCWAYEPPGGLVSKPVADRMQPFVNSVVHAKDIVPRMSWLSLDQLRDDLMVAVARSKVNKNVLSFARRAKRSSFLRPEHLFRDQEPSTGEVAAEMKRYQSDSKKARLEPGMSRAFGCGLPGKLMYIRPLRGSSATEKSGQRCRVYDAVWITREQLAADGIFISKNTVADHDVGRVEAALIVCAERFRQLPGEQGEEGEQEEEEAVSVVQPEEHLGIEISIDGVEG